MKKMQVEMNKSVYLEFVIPDVCKVQMYEFCYDFIQEKYNKKFQLVLPWYGKP